MEGAKIATIKCVDWLVPIVGLSLDSASWNKGARAVDVCWKRQVQFNAAKLYGKDVGPKAR